MAKRKSEAEIEIKCAFDKLVPIGELKPNPRNPNQHPEKQIAILSALIASDGFRNAVVVSNQSGFIVSGHGRLLAAKKIGMPVVPVDFQDYDSPERETAILMSDNIVAELSEFDVPMAGQLLMELQVADYDLSLTALDEDEINRILDELNIEEPSDEDEIPEPSIIDPISKPGDLWLLGEHRVLCGDSTKIKDVKRLMGGMKADMGFTSPPYGIEVDYGGDYKDTFEECCELLRGVAKTGWQAIGDAGFFVINFGDIISGRKVCKEDEPCEYPMAVTHWPIFREQGWLLNTRRIWAKPHARVASPWCAMSNRGASDWEHLWFWKKPGPGLNERRTPSYFGVWDTSEGENAEVGKDVHAAPMAVILPVWAIEIYSNRGAIVWEPFCGTGTTLIACEQLSRTCYAMEIEPRYVDVIVWRWEKYTGKKAILEKKCRKKRPGNL